MCIPGAWSKTFGSRESLAPKGRMAALSTAGLCIASAVQMIRTVHIERVRGGFLYLHTATTLRKPSSTSRSFRLSRSFLICDAGNCRAPDFREAPASRAASRVRSRADDQLGRRDDSAAIASLLTCLEHARNPRYRLHACDFVTHADLRLWLSPKRQERGLAWASCVRLLLLLVGCCSKSTRGRAATSPAEAPKVFNHIAE